jgi:hypothetical protein
MSFDCQSVYEDESRTDQILTRFDIKVQCVISDDSLDLLSQELNTDPLVRALPHVSPADIVSAVQAKLMTPRKALSFQFSGVEFIPGKAGVAGTVDAWNGPKPQGFTPIRMEPGSWILMYHIVAHYRVRLERSLASGAIAYTNLPGNVALYNRWRDRVDIDDRQYTRRTRSGKFMIRSDNKEGFVADQVRTLMAQVGVPEGFLRHRSSYTVSPDGLSLQYEIEDKEAWMMPPKGAYRAQGNYREESTTGDGKRIGTCRVTLWGRKGPVGGAVPGGDGDYSYGGLISTACALVVAKLDAQGANFLADLKLRQFAGVALGRGERATMLSAEIDVGMWDNTVTFTMRVLYPTAGRTVRGMAILNPHTPWTPASTGTTPKVPYTDRGSAGMMLHAAAYYDPDLGATVAPAPEFYDRIADADTPQGPTRLDRGLEPGQAGKTPE